MLEKHNLFGTSMSMLRDGVGSRDGAEGILSAIVKRGEWAGNKGDGKNPLDQRVSNPKTAVFCLNAPGLLG